MTVLRAIGVLLLSMAAGLAQAGPVLEGTGATAAPLDMSVLKSRLRHTDAIGIFAKLALQKEMDALLDQFRAHYESGEKADVILLRHPYDVLILRVLLLLQDGDPLLARAISESREAIWDLLADPLSFAAAT